MTGARRAANLRGTGAGPRANGANFLRSDGPTRNVFDDAEADSLLGAAGQDWAFANLDIGVRDILSSAELVDDLD